MPYADPKKQKAAQAEWYRKKYGKDPEFQKAEAARKAAWLQTDEGKASNAEATARYEKARKAASKPRRQPSRSSK